VTHLKSAFLSLKIRRVRHPFSENGIKAIVVNSRGHGQIYISGKTQDLPELLAIQFPYIPK